MKNIFVLTLSLLVISVSANAADLNASVSPEKKSILGTKAYIVPDTSQPAADLKIKNVKQSKQGYGNVATYKVVDDRDKPITNDWTRPQSWRIGYKNKNRTAINE